ncbi:MAG: hypothetical protein CMH83_21785 [Nocardioides sp.]|nr:hypothetical protein [Nocardioides sp.]
MRRILSTGLIGLGAFLVVMAVMVKFYAYDRLAVVPYEYDSVTELSAPGATVFSAADLRPVTSDLQVVSRTAADPTVDPGDDNRVWIGRTSILRTDVEGATCDPEVDATLPGCFQQSSEKSPFDAKTGLAVSDEECGGCGSWVEQSYVDGESYAVRQVDLDRTGQVFKGPFGLDRADLQWWDGTIGEATTAVYEGEESVDGLRTYKFVQIIEPTTVSTMDLPGSVFGVDEDTVTADVVYGMTRTLWLEPQTGSPIDRVEERGQYFVYDGEQVPAFVGTVSYTDEQVASNVEEYKTTSFLLSGLQTLFPLVLLVLGLLALAGGVMLRRERDDEGQGVSLAKDGSLVGAGQ